MKAEADLVWRDRYTLAAQKSAKQHNFAGIWRGRPNTAGADHYLFSKSSDLISVDAKSGDINAAISATIDQSIFKIERHIANLRRDASRIPLVGEKLGEDMRRGHNKWAGSAIKDERRSVMHNRGCTYDAMVAAPE